MANCATNVTAATAGIELARIRRTTASQMPQTAPLMSLTLRDWRLWVSSLCFFWTLYVCGVISMYSFQRAGGSSLMVEEVVILPAIQDTIFAILTPFVLAVAVRYPIQKPDRLRRSVLYLSGGVVFTLVHVVLRVLAYPAWDFATKKYQWSLINWRTFHVAFSWPALKRLFLWNLVEDIFAVYVPVIVVAHAVLYYMRFRERELRAAQLQAQLSDARLLALRNNLQPHFLFNTMHSISSLMLRDVRAADTMIARLSDLLRMTLEDEGEHLTSLQRELDFTQAYLDIEKIRFGDRLSVTFDVPPQALDIPVPHFLLQPLVENSIKHGISKRTAGGEILVVASVLKDKLRITVCDNGTGRGPAIPSPRTGTGLRTTRERLRTLYGDDHQLNLKFSEEGAVEVTILLPFRQDERLMSHGARIEGVVAFEQS
jgi:two-component system, LytTR family, sensor kinase